MRSRGPAGAGAGQALSLTGKRRGRGGVRALWVISVVGIISYETIFGTLNAAFQQRSGRPGGALGNSALGTAAPVAKDSSSLVYDEIAGVAAPPLKAVFPPPPPPPPPLPPLSLSPPPPPLMKSFIVDPVVPPPIPIPPPPPPQEPQAPPRESKGLRDHRAAGAMITDDALVQWTPPPSQAHFGPTNPSGRARPSRKPLAENFLRARAKTWEKGTPQLTGPYPDEFVPALTARQRPLRSRAPFSLPKPLWPAPTHDPQKDAILALAVNYRIIDYVRFVGSLRRTGYSGDVVLAVAAKMDDRSKKFLMAMDVIAYPVAFNCSKGGSIKHSMECDWHPDQDMALPLAVIRHELYLSWASLYSSRSRLLILDFRDTFFQRDPFESLPLGRQSHRLNPATGQLEKYPFEQLLVLEHWPYKRMSNCPWNSGWVRGCWGSAKFSPMRKHPILCSGSYFATRDGMIDLETELLNEVRKAKCHLKGVPSDQGYVNYLYWAGRLPFATHEIRGDGIVNTVGALMGKNHGGSIGPLESWYEIISRPGKNDTHGGFVLDNDKRTHSAVVHQWDRFFDELYWTVDSVLECRSCYASRAGNPHYSCACFKQGCQCTR